MLKVVGIDVRVLILLLMFDLSLAKSSQMCFFLAESYTKWGVKVLCIVLTYTQMLNVSLNTVYELRREKTGLW